MKVELEANLMYPRCRKALNLLYSNGKMSADCLLIGFILVGKVDKI